MRNWIETDTHRQCCWPRCDKMVRKNKNDVVMLGAANRLGMELASLCPKHIQQSRENSKNA